MFNIRLSRFFGLFMSIVLLTAPLPLAAIAEEIGINISEVDTDIITQNPEESYIYLRKDQGNIADIVAELCLLDENLNSPLHALNEHINNGFSVAEHDAVVQALEYAESIIDKHKNKLDPERLEKIVSDLDDIADNIFVDDSLTRAPHIKSLFVNKLYVDKWLHVRSKSQFDKHIRAKQGINASGHLKVGKSATFKDDVIIEGILSAENAEIENLTLTGSLAFSDLSVVDATVSGTLTVNDIVIEDCINDLCVDTLSANDAVIQNLTLTGALSFTSLSLVDQTVSGTLSVTDEVINGNLTIANFTPAGVIHNNSSGLLSSSLIVNADVSASAAIVDTKLATISTAGKVANSATTAISTDNPNTIVLRDGSGNFATNMITINGTVTNPTDVATKAYVDSSGGAATGANVGVGTGLIFRDKTGNNINFKTLLNGAHFALTNNTNDITLATDATSANTASTIVARDASGNFAAGTISANLSGNATTATTATNFSGSLSGDVTGTQGATIVSFVGGQTAANVAAGSVLANAATSANTANAIVRRDGSGNFVTNMITINGTVTNPTDVATKAYVDSASGATTGANVGVGTGLIFRDKTGSNINFKTLLNGAHFALTNNTNDITLATDATSTNTASTIVARDASGNFAAGIISANLNGNATTATIATNFSGSLSGDITGTQGATVVSLVGGQTAANVAAGSVLANAATSANTANAIVRRDALGGFSAGAVNLTDISTIDATVSGALTVNDIIVENCITNLCVAHLSATDEVIEDFLRFQDLAGGEYIGLQAPNIVPTSYTLTLPSTIPTASQVLRANVTTPTNLEWFTQGGSALPSASKTIYVTKYGNDTTGNGSFDAPYLTLAKAIDVANGIASAINPIAIVISSGIYVENNSSGPLIVTAEGISIDGESPSSVIISPNTPANNLLLVNDTVRISNVCFRASSPLATGVSLVAGTLSVLSNVRFIGFLVGVSCSGGATETYGFNNCLFVANGTAIDVNDTKVECNSCSIFGTATISPAANTGISIAGANSSVAFDGGVCALCETGATITSNAIVSFTGISFRRNSFDVIQDGASHLTLSGCTFEYTDNLADIDLQVSGTGTVTEIIGCEFSGLDILNVGQGTGIQVTDSALVNITGSIIHNYGTGIHLGAPSETSSTILTASSVMLRDCTTDVLQEGATTLQFNACTASSSKISIGDPTNVQLAFFDLEDNGALNIGSMSDNNTTLMQVAIDTVNVPDFNYKSSLYATQAVGLDNTASTTDPSTLFAVSNQNTHITSITTDRTKQAGLRLVSDQGSPIGGTSALRGWDINKNTSAAELSFQYQNSDTIGQSNIAQYTVMQLDGVNNQLQLPTTATQIVFAGDTNLYRSSANVLRTDDNFIVGTLTPDRAVYTALGTNQLTSSTVTGTELGYLSGVTSSIQTQINSKVAKTGDTMTGALQLPAGTTAAPSLIFTGNTTTGLSSAAANTLSLSTNATERMRINSTGVVSINNLTPAGVVHNDVSGNLSSSLIVNADITNATISNAKLATIGSTNTSGAIVVRDGSGNFATNMITIDGAVTNPTDVATKAYVDSIATTGIVAHPPAVVVSTTNVALSGLQTIDGVTLIAGDRVLLVAQTNPVQNGLWEAQSLAWTRPADFFTGDQAGQAYVLITSGTINAGSSYLCSTPTAIIDTNPISFSLFSLPSAITGANVGAGTGLVFKNKTGATLNFRSLLAGAHVAVTNNTDDITIATDATSLNTPNTIVSRDGSGDFSATTITASLTGAASLNVLKAGDTMTGALQLPAGTTALPSLVFTGSTTTGLSANSDILSFSNAGIESMNINASGIVTIDGFSTAGVVHNNASGNLSSSLIVDTDVDPAAAIVDTKLATISTAGKVANSATTAIATNTPNTIVLRDGSGNFAAGTITGSLAGAASLNVLKAGDTMTGALQLPAGTTALPSLVFTGSTTTGLSASSGNLSLSTSGIQRLRIASGGGISIDAFTSAGVVHNDSSGNLSSSLIVNADVSASAGIVDTKLATISTAGKVANSATTATSANTASSIVLRDASGDFAAGTITANLNGNATTATTATNATNFTGSLSGDVTGTQGATVVSLVGGQTAADVAAGSVLANAATSVDTASTIVRRSAAGGFSTSAISVADEVVSSSLTISPFSTAGVVHNNASGLLSSSLIVNADVSASAGIVDTKLATISTAGKVANSATTATSANTASTIVLRDASGDFAAGTITANLNGNATTATTATNATNFTGSLNGDVTGTQGATVVSLVGGQTAADVAAGSVLANAATSANTANAIVRRDGSGNFTTTMITITGTTTNATDVATKAYVDSQTGSGGTNLNTPNTLVQRDGTGSFAAQIVSVVDTVASGNLVLSTNPSTSTAGNIMKGSSSFVHNYGTSNTFVGVDAGNFTTTGTGQNTIVGASGLNGLTSGTGNVGIGYNILALCLSGSNNIALGTNALASATGSSNIAIGSSAGNSLTTGNDNIYIANTGAVESGAIRIGTSGTQTTCFVAGITGVGVSGDVVVVDSNGKLGVTLSSERFKNNIQDMKDVSDDIMQLRPVTFVYNDDENQTLQYGLIAEEVDKIFPAMVSLDENDKPQTVRYQLLPVLLLNEIQKQRKEIEHIKNNYVTKEEMNNALCALKSHDKK